MIFVYHEIIAPKVVNEVLKEEVVSKKIDLDKPSESVSSKIESKSSDNGYDYEGALKLLSNVKQMYYQIIETSGKLEKIQKEVANLENIISAKMKK